MAFTASRLACTETGAFSQMRVARASAGPLGCGRAGVDASPVPDVEAGSAVLPHAVGLICTLRLMPEKCPPFSRTAADARARAWDRGRGLRHVRAGRHQAARAFHLPKLVGGLLAVAVVVRRRL